MLVIKRRSDESITITPRDDVDPSLTLRELFASGAIEVRLLDVSTSRVTLAIDAPPQLKIWRGIRPDDDDEKDAA